MEAPQLEVQATANRTRTVAVEAPRGRILDRNGKVIVDNRTSLVVTMDRVALKKLKKPDRVTGPWCRSWPPPSPTSAPPPRPMRSRPAWPTSSTTTSSPCRWPVTSPNR